MREFHAGGAVAWGALRTFIALFWGLLEDSCSLIPPKVWPPAAGLTWESFLWNLHKWTLHGDGIESSSGWPLPGVLIVHPSGGMQ